MATATLNGNTVTRCTVQIPAWGVSWADVELDQPTTLTGAVTLVVADLTLKGTVMSGGPWQGRARYRIAAGAGQWGKVIPAKSDTNDLGVKTANVIRDAAMACGERVGTLPDGSRGTSFVRAEGPASRVLEEVVHQAWYVDEAGVTQFGRRAARTYTGTATPLPRDLAHSIVELAADSIADLLPGVVVDGVEAVDVEHRLESGKLRTTLWGKGISDTNRLPEAMRRMVDAFTAQHRYYAPWKYRVVERIGERYDLQNVRVSSGMPDLRLVPVRAMAGCRVRPALGSLVLVSFVNGDRSEPAITGFDDPASPGFIPTELALMAGNTGTAPTEHATSAESLVAFTEAMLALLAAAINATGPTPTGPTISAAIVAMLSDSAMSAMVAAVEGVSLGPLTKAAVLSALSIKGADTNGDTPSIGCPNVRLA